VYTRVIVSQWRCSAFGTEEHGERQSRVDGESSVAVAVERRRQARLCLGAQAHGE
jgi:hypothetical protein